MVLSFKKQLSSFYIKILIKFNKKKESSKTSQIYIQKTKISQFLCQKKGWNFAHKKEPIVWPKFLDYCI
jgi:hypothetical protein